MKYVIISILILSLISVNIAYASLNPLDAHPNIPSLCKISNSTHVLSCSGLEDLFKLVGSNGIRIQLNNATKTITIIGSPSPTNHGTYNQTLANNALINSGSYKINFINGTNSTFYVVNDPTRNQVNITVSSTGTSGSGSSPVHAILAGSGISVNGTTGSVVVTNTGVKSLTVVGSGSANATTGNILLTTKTYQNNTGANLGTSGTGIYDSMYGSILQFLKLISANNLLGLSSNGTNVILTIQNVITNTFKSNTSTCNSGYFMTAFSNSTGGYTCTPVSFLSNTVFKSKTFTCSPGNAVTSFDNTTGSYICQAFGSLSSAITSINTDTTAAQTIAGGQGITVTDSGATHTVKTNFKVNSQACSTGFYVSNFNNSTGTYTCTSVSTSSGVQFKSFTFTCSPGNAVTSFNNSTGTYVCSAFGTGSGTVTGSQNVGKATGSFGVLSTASSTTIKGRNMTGTSPISVTKPNDTDITIACSTCLTSALTTTQNTGRGAGSFGVLATPTSSIVKGKNITAGTGISLAGNTTDITITSTATGTITGSQNVGKATSSVGVLAVSSSNKINGRNMTGVSGNVTITKTNDTDIQFNTGNNLAYLAKFNNFTNDNSIASTKKLYFGSTTDYIRDNATSRGMSFYANNIERMRLTQNSTQPVIIGDLTNSSYFGVGTPIQFLRDQGNNIPLITFFTGNGPGLLLKSGDGSFLHPVATPNGRQLSQFNSQGWTGSAFAVGTIIASFADEAWTSTAHGTYISFKTIPVGSTTTTENLRLLSNGGMAMVAAKQFNLDGVVGTGDTYITESSANVMDMFTGGTNILKLQATSATLANKIINTAIADPAAAAGQLWLSSTNADVLKYSSASTLYSISSTKSVTNSTTGQLSGNGTGSASTTMKMDGVYATLTPANTGRITVSVTGIQSSSVISDGCKIGIRQSTTNMGANAAALAGTILGNNLHLLTAVANDGASFSRVYDFTGTVGTKYFFDLSFAAITGGTCTITDVNWNLVEH